MSQRQLPQATDIERALLGSMIFYPMSIETAVEQGLLKDDFFHPAHQIIFKTIVELHEERKPVDSTSLITRLNDDKNMQSVGGIEYIMQLADTAGSSANAKYYVNTIQDRAKLRRLIAAAENIAAEGFDQQGHIDDVMDWAESELIKVTRARNATSFVSAKEVVNETFSNIKKMSENHTPVTGMKTNFRKLDAITNGFQKGDMIILAARPSMGKTAFALQLAMNMAECNNKPIAFYSLEMDAEALMRRMLSSKSELDGNKLRSGYGITKTEMNALAEAVEEIAELPIYFNDNSQAVTIGNITSSCRKLQSEKGLGAIFIDYIQLMTGSGKTDSRQQEVSEISRSLKQIAREFQVPVIALSQLSRSVEKRSDNKRPMLSDLRESGALEQDADMIMFLYRDSYYAYTRDEDSQPQYEEEENNNDTEKMEVIIAKHRNGATDTVELAYKRSFNAFYDYDYTHTEQ